MPRRIPIRELREFGKKVGLTHAILFGFDGKLNHIVTWGKDRRHAAQAAQYGNVLKDFAGWPEKLHAEPARLTRLEKRNKELEAEIKKLQAEVDHLWEDAAGPSL